MTVGTGKFKITKLAVPYAVMLLFFLITQSLLGKKDYFLTTFIMNTAIFYFLYGAISFFMENTAVEDWKELYARGYYWHLITMLPPYLIFAFFIVMSIGVLYKY